MNTDENLYRPISILALITALILTLPLIAMQFSTEINWTLSDFVISGILLFGTGLTYILVTRITDDRGYRVAVSFTLLTVLLLIWANLAVGIIGSEDNPANLMYFGVIAVGIIGALIARFRSKGMVFVMIAVAVAQTVVIVVALIAGMQQLPGSSVIEIIGVNGFFITLFVVSGLLFRNASQEQSP